MVKVEDSFGDKMVQATITIKIECYLNENDDREFISEEEAISLAKRQLSEYACSNDGSELLLNVPKSRINFENIQ